MDLSRADDPRDVVHRVVAALAQGGLVVMPLDRGLGYVASALGASAGRIAGGSGEAALAVRGVAEAGDWVPRMGDTARRLMLRCWPGPLELRFAEGYESGLASVLGSEARAAVTAGGVLCLRSPSHRAMRDVLTLVPGPLVVSEAPADVDVASRTPGTAMVVVDGGPVNDPGPSVVEFRDGRWRVVREAALSEAEIRSAAAKRILFICTGNTCRSPMASALGRAMLAKRLGVTADRLNEAGYDVSSAGVAASEGMPAAAHAIEVVKSRGGSLQGHASRRATERMVLGADYVVAMTRDHLDLLLDAVPEVEGRARLLHSGGGDIDDPVGMDLGTYRKTADEIERHLSVLLDEVLNQSSD